MLTVGETLTLDLTLRLGEIHEILTVSGAGPRVDTQDAQLSSLVDDRRVLDLPLNGRNVYVLATLPPGVIAPLESIANADGPNSSAFFAAGSRLGISPE